MNEKAVESYVICKNYTKINVAEEIVGLALQNNMVVFGGYVRDRDILGLNTFNDIDIVYFKIGNYNTMISMINACGYMKEIRETSVVPYGMMSHIITNVTKVKIIGICGKKFPESMHFSIDFVRCKDNSITSQTDITVWKSKKDTDFSCNLFYKDYSGIHIKYVPDNIYFGNLDPFTFLKKMTVCRKFYPVVGDIDILESCQLFKYHARGTKLVKNGWKMMYIPESPFTIGLYRNIKLKDRTDCSLCLNTFTKKTIIVNTICKHSFCGVCFKALLLNTDFVAIPSCPNCRHPLSKREITLQEDID
jgi:hypothetical protein